jgi:predicted Zn-dependent protease
MLLGEIDNERNALKGALKAFTKVTALDPANAEAFYNLGEVAFELKQKKTARAALASYLKLEPTGDLAANAKALLAKL